jgi:hypothetical protein
MSTEIKLLGALAVTAGALAAPHGTAARPAPSVIAVVDRTFFCTRVAPSTVNVWASSPFDPVYFKGYLAVTSGPDTPHPLLYVRQRSSDGGGYPVEPGVFARVGSPGCFTSRQSVPLSSTGLPGPPVRWEQMLKCRVQGGVLVRVHAVVQAGGAWLRVNPRYRGARGVVTRASLAVRSARTRKPLAFVTVDPASKLRVWSAPVCG